MKRFLLALIFFCLALPVRATIFINEILPDPSTSDTDDEWIELYNDSDFDIDITGYLLQDAANHEFTIPTATVSAHSYYIWQRLGGTLSLNNSNEIISLFDINKNILDEFAYTSSKTDQSWNRSPDGSDNWLILSPTFNSSNPTPTPEPSPSPSPTPSPTSTPEPTSTPTSSAIASATADPTPTPSINPSSASPAVTLAEEGTVAGLTVDSIHLTPVRSSSPSPSPNLKGQALEGPALNIVRARTALLVGFGLITISVAGFLGYQKYKSLNQL